MIADLDYVFDGFGKHLEAQKKLKQIRPPVYAVSKEMDKHTGYVSEGPSMQAKQP